MFFPKEKEDGSLLGIVSGLVGRQKPNYEVPASSKDPQRKITDIFADLEAGDRLRDQREAERREGTDRRSGADRRQNDIGPAEGAKDRRVMPDRRNAERREAEEPVRPTPAASAPVAAAPAPPPAAAPAPPSAPAQPARPAASTPAAPPVPSAASSGSRLDEFKEAQRRATERREAIQAMLDEARRLEDQLAVEASTAKAAAEQANVEKKLAAVAEFSALEQAAHARIDELQKLIEDLVKTQTENVAAQKSAEDAHAKAKSSLTECEASLAEFKTLASDAEKAVLAVNERVARAKEVAEGAKADADAAAAYAKECSRTREATEVALRDAQSAVDHLSPSPAALEELRELERRIADKLGVA